MSSAKQKRTKNCIFVSMVPTVILLFVLYLIVYMGTMTNSLKAENFTISDALKFPPPQVILANNLEAMAYAALKRPNRFMQEDSEVGETKAGHETWTWPTRPTTMESSTFASGLKRGPALTFLEPDPKSMEIEPYQTRFNQTQKQRYFENFDHPDPSPNFFSNEPSSDFVPSLHNDFEPNIEEEMLKFGSYKETFDSGAPDFDYNSNSRMDFFNGTPDYDYSGHHSNARMDFFNDDTNAEDDFSKLSQEDLEADYFEERKQFGDEEDKSDQLLTPPDDPKVEREGLNFEESRFDQLVTFKPRLEDKSGYDRQIGDAQIIHHKSGYSDHGAIHGGYSEHKPHGGYSEHKPQGGYEAHRNPGPYGYPSPNFKCEYAKETLYVTKTEWTFDKKCFTVYRTKCRQEYEHGKGIGFQKECSEFTVTRCRTEYDTESDTKCWTVFRKECFQVYVTKVDWEYEEKCETKFEEVCEGYGYDKHCEQVPKEHCTQIPVKVEKQVPKTKCKKVPEKKCQDFPVFIPRKACKDFPKTVCVKDPINVPRKIPKKVCASIPKEVCNKIPVQIIKHVPKTVTKKVCTSTKPSGYSPYSDDASYHPPPASHSTYHDYHSSHSNIAPIVANSGQGSDHANMQQYFDGVADVPHFNYE